MYKTIWMIHQGKFKIELTWYHFGKEPKFPTWYMEADTVYEIKMIWNIKLAFNFKTFMECLTHSYIIK